MRITVPIVALLWATVSMAAPLEDATGEVKIDERDSRFHFYNMPTPEAGPCDLTTGPDGRIWVQYFLVNKLAAIDPTTGAIEEFEIPYKNSVLNISLPGEAPGRSGLTACAIQPGNDGNIYACSGVRNEFVKVTLKTKKVSVFPTGNDLGNLQPLNDLWRGAKGMWFSQTTANKITLFNYKTEKFTDYDVPTVGGTPVGMRVAADGNLWYTELLGNKIVKMDQSTGAMKEYDVPTPLTGPAVMRAETTQDGGNYLWFTGFTGNSMGRVNIANGKIDTHPAAALDSFPVEDDSDSYGRVWYSTATTNTLNFINPYFAYKNTQIKEPGSSLTSPLGVPPAANIAIHYGPQNKIWFTDLSLNRVGTYQLFGCGKNYNPCTG